MIPGLESGTMASMLSRKGKAQAGALIVFGCEEKEEKEGFPRPLGPGSAPWRQEKRPEARGQIFFRHFFPLLILFSCIGVTLAAGVLPAESLIEEGSQVPRFELPQVGGGNFRLAQELGSQPLLLVYWSLYCDVCRRDLPRIQKMYEGWGGAARMKAVAINGDGKSAAPLVQKYWQRERFTIPCLLDEERGEGFWVEGLLGVEETPAVVLLSPGGRVLYSQEGKIDFPSLEEAIRKKAR